MSYPSSHFHLPKYVTSQWLYDDISQKQQQAKTISIKSHLRGKMTDTWLIQIIETRSFPIESVDISFCNQITTIGLEYLARLPHLKTLDLTGCWRPSRKGCPQIKIGKILEIFKHNTDLELRLPNKTIRRVPCGLSARQDVPFPPFQYGLNLNEILLETSRIESSGTFQK